MAEPDPTVFSVQPAAHEDAKVDARSAAKWLIAAFAAVGAVLVSGIGFSSIGDLRDWDLAVAIIAGIAGVGGAIIAVTLIGDVLTPKPVTLANLAESQQRCNEGNSGNSERQLIEYLRGDPSFLQGIAGDAPAERSLIVAREAYETALITRYRTAETAWEFTQKGDTESPAATQANAAFKAANAQASTMHFTVRRLERVAAAQQTVLRLRSRQKILSLLAAIIATSIGAFAFVSSSSDLKNDFPGTVLEKVCPDGASSDRNGYACAGHLVRKSESRLHPGASSHGSGGD